MSYGAVGQGEEPLPRDFELAKLEGGGGPSSGPSPRWRGSVRDLERRETPGYALGLCAGVVVYFGVGVVYYASSTGWGIVDSVYFTAQTITTVGKINQSSRRAMIETNPTLHRWGTVTSCPSRPPSTYSPAPTSSSGSASSGRRSAFSWDTCSTRCAAGLQFQQRAPRRAQGG